MQASQPSRPTESAAKLGLIFVVDDDAELRELLAQYLASAGYEVWAAESGAALDQFMQQRQPDLVVLDVMMPGEDGLAICRRLRAAASTPILMLTAASEAIDRVIGIELGADDYMAKPFLPRELLARVKAILRRSAREIPASVPRLRYRFADWILDDNDGRLHSTLSPPRQPLQLTAGEYRLLHAMVTAPGRVLTREAIAQAVQGRAFDAFDRSVDVAVSRMRKKLAQTDAQPQLIKTVHALGYVFTAKVEVLAT